MSKKYIVSMAVIFILGLGLGQLYSPTEQVVEMEAIPAIDLQALTFHGQAGQRTYPFDIDDPRTRILYFGFTKCPDVCPTSLAVLAGALNQLNEAELTKFHPIFISLDPERDLAENANDFAGYFHPQISGMVTSLAETPALADHYGVFYKKVELEDSRLGYTLDHTSYFYFVKPDGRLIQKVPHTMTPKPLLEVMNTITASPTTLGQ